MTKILTGNELIALNYIKKVSILMKENETKKQEISFNELRRLKVKLSKFTLESITEVVNSWINYECVIAEEYFRLEVK